jgi:hypothetical protein
VCGQGYTLTRKIFEQFILEGAERNHNCPQTKRIYVSRTFGGNIYHSVADGDIAADTGQSTKTGQSNRLSVEPEAIGDFLFDVLEG